MLPLDPNRSGRATPRPKFSQLKKWGTLVVPGNYQHKSCITDWSDVLEGSEHGLFYRASSFNDRDLPRPDHVLLPGMRLRVSEHRVTNSVYASQDSWLGYLSSFGEQVVYVGAHGLVMTLANLSVQFKRDKPVHLCSFAAAKANGRPSTSSDPRVSIAQLAQSGPTRGWSLKSGVNGYELAPEQHVFCFELLS